MVGNREKLARVWYTELHAYGDNLNKVQHSDQRLLEGLGREPARVIQEHAQEKGGEREHREEDERGRNTSALRTLLPRSRGASQASSARSAPEPVRADILAQTAIVEEHLSDPRAHVSPGTVPD